MYMYMTNTQCTCTSGLSNEVNGYVQVPDQRFEEDHHNSDEVCRVDNVELLGVLLVPEREGGREGGGREEIYTCKCKDY